MGLRGVRAGCFNCGYEAVSIAFRNSAGSGISIWLVHSAGEAFRVGRFGLRAKCPTRNAHVGLSVACVFKISSLP